jgi:alpha-L-rhamnosidase
MSRLFGSLVVLSVASLAFAADADVVVRDLRCEYMTNPLGLDTPAPRLSWTIASEASGVEQIAYQVQVGTSPEGEADLWDTGRVESAQRVHIEYAGKPLRSGQRAYWRVRVWTNRGDEPTRYSAPAWFEMGLMKPEDWTARWIGAEADRKPHPALGEEG